MKYILSAVLCFFLLTASAQISDTVFKDNFAKLDSQAKELKEAQERNLHRMDSINMARTTEQMGRNLDSFMAERKEQERKKMKGVYLRLGFGVLMLIVLIVGWVRKRKQK